MATKKPKTTSKTTKAKTTKSKTAAKTVEKPVTEAPKTVVGKTGKAKGNCLCGFFAKKYEGEESIMTVFKTPKFYGALIGEVLGTAVITMLIFACSLMGIQSIATYSFALIAVFVAIYAFSGACLNPIVTVGMMATRRMSVIRGVMYIIAEVIGAWIGWLIFNSFHLAGGDTAYAIPAMTEVAEGKMWITTLVELFGAIIIGFFFARAIKYKRSVFTFAAVVAGGMVAAILLGFIASAAFLGLQNNFVFNPATALMFQIFPVAGEGFGEIFGGICQALAIYALFPMIGGVAGFYLADFTSKLSNEE